MTTKMITPRPDPFGLVDTTSNPWAHLCTSNSQPVKHTYEVDFFEVKEAYRALAAGERDASEFGGPYLGIMSYLVPLMRHRDEEDSWMGGSVNQTLEWMEKGFSSEAIKAAIKRVATVVKRKSRFNPLDGTPVLERVYSGDTHFFKRREKRPLKPGLTINADMWFAGSTSATVIGEYGGFLAGLIQSLENRGFDLEVNLVTDVGALMQGDSRQTRSQIFTRIKKRGQKSRFHSWSCVLAPTGFRHLMFFGFHVVGAKYGKLPTDHLATALQRSAWGLVYDAKKNEIRITVQQISASSGLEILMAQAEAAGLI